VSLRVLIVDDSSSFLEAATVLLEGEGLTVAGAVSTATEAVRQVEALSPDVVLVDVFLREESGLELARRLVEDGLRDDATVILISTHDEADLADLVETSRAAGFLPKGKLSAGAIRRIVDGRSR
jgi:CheY-like chemotaxis protein